MSSEPRILFQFISTSTDHVTEAPTSITRQLQDHAEEVSAYVYAPSGSAIDSHADRIVACVANAFAVSLPDETLSKLSQIKDPTARMKATEEELRTHSGGKLTSFLSRGAGEPFCIVNTRTETSLRSLFRSSMVDSMSHGWAAVAKQYLPNSPTPAEVLSVMGCENFDPAAAISADESEFAPYPVRLLLARMRKAYSQLLLSGRLDRIQPSSENQGAQSQNQNQQQQEDSKSIAPKASNPHKVLYIHFAATSKTCQASGLGFTLGQLVIKRASKLGYTHLFAECTNPTSQHVFIKKLGFTALPECSTRYGEYVHPDGSMPFVAIQFPSVNGDPRIDSACVLCSLTL